jgi:large subunit ribosomal protein L15
VNIDEVNRGIQRHKKRRRIGRGPGSGWGKTAGRGHKGQKSRAGWSSKSTFQGGCMPLVRRIPKRGFHNKFAVRVVTVNLSDLERAFESGADVNPVTLHAKNLARARWDQLKVLGNGQLTKKLKVCAHRFSQTAQEKIEQAGGEVVILPAPTPVAVKKRRKRLDAAGASA